MDDDTPICSPNEALLWPLPPMEERASVLDFFSVGDCSELEGGVETLVALSRGSAGGAGGRGLCHRTAIKGILAEGQAAGIGTLKGLDSRFSVAAMRCAVRLRAGDFFVALGAAYIKPTRWGIRWS